METERESIGSSERQLNLLSAFLKERGPLSWTEVARIDGYNDTSIVLRSRQKRFERDIKALEDAGLKFERNSDPMRRTYELNRSACLLPALNLSTEQRLLMFRVGMAYLQDSGDGPLRQHLSAALVKLQAGAGSEGLPANLPQAFVRRTLNRRPGEAARLDVICPALIERRHIQFTYAGRGKQGADTRTVAPYALVARRGGWYLVGFDVARKAERTFRLSRMRGEVQLAKPRQNVPEYEVPPGFDPEGSFSADIFGRGENAFQDVRIAFDAEVGFVVENEFAGIYDVRKRRDGSVILHLPQAYPEELLRYLGEFAGHWEVQQPAALRKLVVQRLKTTLKGLDR